MKLTINIPMKYINNIPIYSGYRDKPVGVNQYNICFDNGHTLIVSADSPERAIGIAENNNNRILKVTCLGSK